MYFDVDKGEEVKNVFLVGEVKGRKDLSNTWESWIPQVNSHLESWAATFPHAYRGVFMTVVTEGMLTGSGSRLVLSRTSAGTP